MNAPRVLVVDDNPDLRALMQLLLEEHGCEVRTVPDGSTALEAFQALGPQVVFVDLHLPQMDGFTLARRLLAPGATPPPTVVLCSGYVDASVRERARRLGIRDVVEKVGDVDALERAILAALGGGAHAG